MSKPTKAKAMTYRIKSRVAVIALAAIWAGPSWGEPRLSGAGARSCRVLATIAASRTPVGRAAVQWSLGFLTGRVQAPSSERQRPFGGPDGIVLDLVAYCRQYPDAQVADAAASFFQDAALPPN